MLVRVITPPLPLLGLDEVKDHLSIDREEDHFNAYLTTLIAAAQGWIDGPHGWLEQSIGVQQLEWSLCDWPQGEVTLPFGPVIEVAGVRYIDRDGTEHELPVETPLRLEGVPTVRGRQGDVKITYWAGYGERNAEPSENGPDWVNKTPDGIKHALKLIIGQWFISRAAVRIGDSVATLPFGVEALLQPFRKYQ